jgi:hypothetical protein
MILYAVVDDSLSRRARWATPSTSSSGATTPSASSTMSAATIPELASYLRIEERKLEAGETSPSASPHIGLAVRPLQGSV